MTQKIQITPIAVVSALRTTNGTSRHIREVASFKRVLIALNVSAVNTGTSLNIYVRMVDPLSGNQIRVKTRAVGINSNGAFTEGDLSLGDFGTVTTTVPYTEIRALTDTEMFTDDMIIEWVMVGTSYTFSVTVLGETEETG